MTQRSQARMEPAGEIVAASRRWLDPVRAALGSGFRAAYLTGSVLTQGFDPRRSGVNLLVVARDLDAATLDRVAEALPAASKPRIDPLFFTEAQVRKSLDSFPIEWIEIQEAHLLVEGADVLGNLEVPRTYLRLQCEQELRQKLVRLRQFYVLNARHPDRLGAFLQESASGFSALFRTLLRLAGESPPADPARVIERVADLHHLAAEGLLGAWLARSRGRLRGSEARDLYRGFLTEIERLVGAIDSLQVA